MGHGGSQDEHSAQCTAKCNTCDGFTAQEQYGRPGCLVDVLRVGAVGVA